jgi:hypothetical protein
VLPSGGVASALVGLEGSLDIEEFYDQNPKRRTSEELEFGRDWHDAGGTRYELNWVRDTGELYAMGEPTEPIIPDPVGGEYLARMPDELVTVEVLGVVPTLEGVEHLLAGWPEAMGEPNSLQWVRTRLAEHAESSSGPIPPGEQPEELPGADS